MKLCDKHRELARALQKSRKRQRKRILLKKEWMTISLLILDSRLERKKELGARILVEHICIICIYIICMYINIFVYILLGILGQYLAVTLIV